MKRLFAFAALFLTWYLAEKEIELDALTEAKKALETPIT